MLHGVRVYIISLIFRKKIAGFSALIVTKLTNSEQILNTATKINVESRNINKLSVSKVWLIIDRFM